MPLQVSDQQIFLFREICENDTGTVWLQCAKLKWFLFGQFPWTVCRESKAGGGGNKQKASKMEANWDLSTQRFLDEAKRRMKCSQFQFGTKVRDFIGRMKAFWSHWLLGETSGTATFQQRLTNCHPDFTGMSPGDESGFQDWDWNTSIDWTIHSEWTFSVHSIAIYFPGFLFSQDFFGTQIPFSEQHCSSFCYTEETSAIWPKPICKKFYISAFSCWWHVHCFSRPCLQKQIWFYHWIKSTEWALKTSPKRRIFFLTEKRTFILIYSKQAVWCLQLPGVHNHE